MPLGFQESHPPLVRLTTRAQYRRYVSQCGPRWFCLFEIVMVSLQPIGRDECSELAETVAVYSAAVSGYRARLAAMSVRISISPGLLLYAYRADPMAQHKVKTSSPLDLLKKICRLTSLVD